MPPIRVLIVDDSAVVRRMLTDILASDPELVIAGVASSGQQVLERIVELKPDLVTLDVEMPGMDGITTLVEIRKRYPRLPVIMFSSLTGPAAAATIEALARGASDYVTKPSSLQNGLEVVRNELLPKIKALCHPPTPSAHPPSLPIPTRPPLPTRVDILAIGSSTGGPNALAKLIPEFPADFCVPVVIVAAHAAHVHQPAFRSPRQSLQAESPGSKGWRKTGKGPGSNRARRLPHGGFARRP